PYAKTGEMELRLTARADDGETAEKILEPLKEEVLDILGDFVYAEGEDNSLQNTVVELLRKSGKTVATAESCTGGLVAKRITEIPGSSECFECGFVTYSNEQKTERLGVNKATLDKYGAVSPEVAFEMCKGARDKAGADIGIGITGIAGPGGGTDEKPVGLVYIGICTEDVHATVKLNLTGGRGMVRERTSLYALDLIRRSVLGILSTIPTDKKVLDTQYIW
ncbi:MAG: nicotinamide-nucleotide amidohydrolase family protein, partial [Clostridia bacterium]|nr:nicotinamide-nucleotide amidohydrolase family protein [Clostridia bacterium]